MPSLISVVVTHTQYTAGQVIERIRLGHIYMLIRLVGWGRHLYTITHCPQGPFPTPCCNSAIFQHYLWLSLLQGISSYFVPELLYPRLSKEKPRNILKRPSYKLNCFMCNYHNAITGQEYGVHTTSIVGFQSEIDRVK